MGMLGYMGLSIRVRVPHSQYDNRTDIIIVALTRELVV